MSILKFNMINETNSNNLNLLVI